MRLIMDSHTTVFIEPERRDATDIQHVQNTSPGGSFLLSSQLSTDKIIREQKSNR